MRDFLCLVGSIAGAVLVWRGFVGWAVRGRGWKLPFARIAAVPVTLVGWFVLGAMLFGIFDPSRKQAPVAATAAAAAPPPKPASVQPPAAPLPPPKPKVFDLTPEQFMARVNKALHTHVKGERKRGLKLDTYTAHVGHDMHFVAGVDQATGKIANVVVLAPLASGAALKAEASRAGSILGAAMSLGEVAQAEHLVDDMRQENEAFGNAPSRAVANATLTFSLVDGIGMMAGVDHDPRDPPPTLDGSPEGYVYPQCKQAVESRLRSPASADFPWGADRVVQNPHDPTSFLVFGHVDAQNGFGAMLRADWACQIAYKGGDHYDSASWSIFNVALQER